MAEPFPPATPYLPGAVLHFDLLGNFLVYITIVFATNFVLRLRFYYAVYRIAEHLRVNCPNIFELLRRHLLGIVSPGLLWLVGTYAVLYFTYLSLSRLVFPTAEVTLDDMASVHPALVVFGLSSIGLMLSVDIYLTSRISNVDADQVKRDLSWAESWLGGRVNQWLGRLLGDWNPIRRIARSHVRDALKSFNVVFRNSVLAMIVQMGVRVAVGAAIFGTHLLQESARTAA